MFSEIPTSRPQTPLLDTVNLPADLRALAPDQLQTLAKELRHFLLYTVGQTGGHFGAGLGVVELTIALHYVFDTPSDQLVWDVGHQAYPHKILTGRREAMATLRKPDGIAPFPVRTESEYDTFGVGHSSTSISAALGMAIAKRMRNDGSRTVAVIGDGAMTAGMAFEALNHVADTNANMLVVLNDNAMSISHNVGGLSKYFARVLGTRHTPGTSQGPKEAASGNPQIGNGPANAIDVPGTLLEELGLDYIGPIDGHDLPSLVSTLQKVRDREGPQFLHVVTQKGKGYGPAEASPVGTHSLTKIEKDKPGTNSKKLPSYANVFGDWLCDMAASDERLVGITPAMREGSDLVRFSETYPDRYFDVAIAEQHAVTLAAGLACEGARPVVAIYSTFLQRAYDQLIHDVAIQNLDVLFAIDRAGLLEDGPTHSGVFDYAYLRSVPNVVVMAPADENELRQMLYTGYHYEGPAAVRYPRGAVTGGGTHEAMSALEIGKARRIAAGKDIVILSFGTMLHNAAIAAKALGATLVDMRFVKPLDEAIVVELARQHALLVTVEEHVLSGGAGSAVNECLAAHGINIATLNLGIPDVFVHQDTPAAMLAACGLDAEGIIQAVGARVASRQKGQESGNPRNA